jgi:hypothetical protein
MSEQVSEQAVMPRLVAAMVQRQVDLGAASVAQWIEEGKLPGMPKARDAQPKSPQAVHQFVLDYGSVASLDAWLELLAAVVEVPAVAGWSGRYWSVAVDWVVELGPVREQRAGVEAADARDESGVPVLQSVAS